MKLWGKEKIKELIELKNEAKRDKKKLQKIKPLLSKILTDENRPIAEKLMALSWVRELSITSEANSLVFCFANRFEKPQIRMAAYELFSRWIKEKKIKRLPNQMLNGLQIEPSRYNRYMEFLFDCNPKFFSEKILELVTDERFPVETRKSFLKKMIEAKKKNIIQISQRKYTKKIMEMLAKLVNKIQKIEKNKQNLVDGKPDNIIANADRLISEKDMLYKEIDVFLSYLSLNLLDRKSESFLLDFVEILYMRDYKEIAAKFIPKINSGEMVQIALDIFEYLKKKREDEGTMMSDEEKEVLRYLGRYKIIPFNVISK